VMHRISILERVIGKAVDIVFDSLYLPKMFRPLADAIRIVDKLISNDNECIENRFVECF
jgi:hypothetical protein